jgi:hypothetical protein
VFHFFSSSTFPTSKLPRLQDYFESTVLTTASLSKQGRVKIIPELKELHVKKHQFTTLQYA